MSDETPFERGLDKALQQAYCEIDELKAEARRREKIWLGRLQEADARATRVWQAKLDPSMNPGDHVIESSRDIYFRDFLRSFWRRLTGRRAA